uniref:Uncharacterized protein n=1 Tax=Meloidogyne incognita TaxID=6306 RepID=A0A914KS28_MELIC
MDYAPMPISSNITTWFLLAVFIFVGLSGFIGNLLTVMVRKKHGLNKKQSRHLMVCMLL